MKNVIETPTPSKYLNSDWLSAVDFSDTFSTTNHEDSLEKITNLIFNKRHKWIDALFWLRNKMMSLVGLKFEMPEDYSDAFKVGGYVSFFKIFAISEKEIVLGANDTHLNFRAVVVNDNSETYNIKAITLVEYNNTLGKIYMAIIKPFHRLVVKQLVSNAFKHSN